MANEKEQNSAADTRQLVQTHFRWGWTMLLVFLTFGFCLELLHGFKAGIYLDASNEVRRMLWTLTHAHGALLSLVHMAFAAYLYTRIDCPQAQFKLASRTLMGGSILLPVSFFLGGLYIYEGDPGLFIYLAPFGALLLFIAVFLTARSVNRTGPEGQ
jgi:hypothetical protein